MPDSAVPQVTRSIVVTAPGGPEVLAVSTGPNPSPGPGEVLVKVAAGGVNFIDVYKREGRYPQPTPFVLGDEVAGEVVAVGIGVSNVEVGQVIATTEAHGGFADYALVTADRTAPVPEGLAADVACAAMLQGMTAHYLTTSTYSISPGDEVLVHAAAGGTGQLLVQLATARGARVVATVGSADKVTIARDAGADEVIRYDLISTVDDLATHIREASHGGVQVAYDGVGKATFEASLASLRPRGTLVLFGAASGPVPPFDLQRLNAAGSLFVTRPTLKHYVSTREELLWRAGEMLGAVADGELRISIGGRYGFEQVADAYRDLEGRRTTGKLLIVP